MWMQRASRPLIPLFRLLWGGPVRGAAHVPPGGPLLVAPNHASFLDPWILGTASPRTPLRYVITARWYRRSRVWRGFFESNGVIPTDPERPADTIERVLAALAAGDAVVVFPEGRISATGQLGRGRPGLGWMAALSGAPVVPCGLRGNYELLPRHRRVPRAHPVSLTFGPARVFPGGACAIPDPLAVTRFVGEVMDDLCELADQTERREDVRPLPITGTRFEFRDGRVVLRRSRDATVSHGPEM